MDRIEVEVVSSDGDSVPIRKVSDPKTGILEYQLWFVVLIKWINDTLPDCLWPSVTTGRPVKSIKLNI